MEQDTLQDFADRLQRIEGARLRSALHGPAPSRWSRLATQIAAGLKLASLCAAAIIGLKAALMFELGPEAYAKHRTTLEHGNSIDRISAVLMAPDPVTWLVGAGMRGAVTNVAAADGVPGVVTDPLRASLAATTRDTASGGAAGPVLRAAGSKFLSAPRSDQAAQAVGIVPVGPKVRNGGVRFIQAPVPTGK